MKIYPIAVFLSFLLACPAFCSPAYLKSAHGKHQLIVDGKPTMLVRVEEGHFNTQGEWVFERVWNGDQTDWGLNFTSVPHILKVHLSTY